MNKVSNSASSVSNGVEAGFSAALLDTALPGTIVVNASQQIIACNPIAAQILRMPAENLAGAPISALPSPLLQPIQETLDSGNAVARRTVRVPTLDRILSVSTHRGAATGAPVILVEIQDLNAARGIAANLEHLDRLASLGVVTAGVAHELKNALVAVRTFFDLMALGESDPDLRAVASGEIQRIERTIRQLLRGARREDCRFAALSVHALLQDALNLVRHELQIRSVDIETQLGAQNDRINGDERQLRHTIVNLLINAAEAMPNGGRLSIDTQIVDAWERQHVRITIADTGNGISAENLERLFSPFFTTKPEGTGLGLAISRRIVNSHNGVITAQSEPGHGTTFEVFLPLI